MKKLATILCLLTLTFQTHAGNPQVQFVTNFGEIELELFQDKAPKTVANFLTYVEQGFYNDTIFHRVIKGFMIQGGGFTTDFLQKPTNEAIENEAKNRIPNEIGTIAMARTNHPHSATAQFFINVADNNFLNFRNESSRGYGYAVFGKVTKGMKIVRKISLVETGGGGPFSQDVPIENVVIESITVIKE